MRYCYLDGPPHNHSGGSQESTCTESSTSIQDLVRSRKKARILTSANLACSHFARCFSSRSSALADAHALSVPRSMNLQTDSAHCNTTQSTEAHTSLRACWQRFHCAPHVQPVPALVSLPPSGDAPLLDAAEHNAELTAQHALRTAFWRHHPHQW